MIDMHKSLVRLPCRIQKAYVLCNDPCRAAEVKLKAAVDVQFVSKFPGRE